MLLGEYNYAAGVHTLYDSIHYMETNRLDAIVMTNTPNALYILMPLQTGHIQIKLKL